MASVLSPIAPAGAPLRDAMATTLSTAPRTVAPVSPVETARAPRPVDGGNPAEIARNHKQSERPVGPPPAFEINVLQDIRSRLTAPPEGAVVEEAEQPPADPPGAEIGTEVAAEPPGDPAPRPALLGTDPEPPHQLDMKV